jgi:hypothetical protein
MHYLKSTEEFELANGKRLKAQHGIVRISPEDPHVWGEFNPGIDEWAQTMRTPYLERWTSLSPDERREVADYMIQQWQRWGDRQGT